MKFLSVRLKGWPVLAVLALGAATTVTSAALVAAAPNATGVNRVEIAPGNYVECRSDEYLMVASYFWDGETAYPTAASLLREHRRGLEVQNAAPSRSEVVRVAVSLSEYQATEAAGGRDGVTLYSAGGRTTSRAAFLVIQTAEGFRIDSQAGCEYELTGNRTDPTTKAEPPGDLGAGRGDASDE